MLIGAGITTVILVQQPLGRAPATPPPSAVVGTGETDFGAAGVQYATEKRFVSINLSSLPVSAKRIGLPADGTVTIPPSDFGNTLRLIDKTSNVQLHGISAITVTSSGGSLAAVTFTIEGIGTSDVRKQLLADVATLGIDGSQIAPLDTAIKSAQHDGAGYSEVLEPGNALGVAITPGVVCGATGACTITYSVDVATP